MFMICFFKTILKISKPIFFDEIILNLIYASSVFQRARSQLLTLKTAETGTLLVSESPTFPISLKKFNFEKISDSDTLPLAKVAVLVRWRWDRMHSKADEV